MELLFGTPDEIRQSQTDQVYYSALRLNFNNVSGPPLMIAPDGSAYLAPGLWRARWPTNMPTTCRKCGAPVTITTVTEHDTHLSCAYCGSTLAIL